MTLREVLHAHIPTLNQESTLRDAIDKMDIYQFPALVIVDDNAKPTHVITEGDIGRAVQVRDSLTKIQSDLAKQYASANPTVSSPDQEINDALHTMLQSGLTVLPVVEEDRLIGMVMRMDLMHALLVDAATLK
ncbi:MAG: CBS domain-containing protein [Armatimonadetes bacterium]|nr:CBS domain-containing protein [Armatimonadota bacterium]